MPTATVLITGCSSGFGYLTALDLARRGLRVFATARQPGKARTLLDIAADESLPLTLHQLDVTDTRSIERVIEEMTREGTIDALVNNAGYALRGPLETLADDELSRQFDTNVTGLLRMVRAVALQMRAQGTGTIVNISSLSGIIGVPFEGAYSASKHAVEGLSQALSYELAPAGIRVRIVEPGAFETSFVTGAAESRNFDEAHPLWADYHRFWEAAAELTGGARQDPDAVVEAIRRAVLDPTTPFRQLIGDDVQLAVTMRMEAGLDDFGPAIREMLGLTFTP